MADKNMSEAQKLHRITEKAYGKYILTQRQIARRKWKQTQKQCRKVADCGEFQVIIPNNFSEEAFDEFVRIAGGSGFTVECTEPDYKIKIEW